MSPRKSNTDMIESLEAQLREAKAKVAEKAKTRAAYLVEVIKSCKEQKQTIEVKAFEKIEAVGIWRDERLSKIDAKQVAAEDELADLAVDTADTSQLSFDSVEADEV